MPIAVRFHQTGGPEVLKLEEDALGDPGEGQARVRHTAIGVNFIDTYHRSGLYPLPLPSAVGSEGGGVVEAVGPGVSHIQPGDRVAYAGGVGSYAEVRLMPADRLLNLPGGISDQQAAAIVRNVVYGRVVRPIKATETRQNLRLVQAPEASPRSVGRASICRSR